MAEEYIEVSEKTLEDAITAACQKLSVTSDCLDYIVVDQGSSGFLGFNARNAVIKARVREDAPRQTKGLGDVLTEDSADMNKKVREDIEDKAPDESYSHYQNESDESVTDFNAEPVNTKPSRKEEPKKNYTDEQIEDAIKMQVEITTSFDKDNNILTVDFEGDDMGVLIGKRGQTLDSIQYLVSLVVNKGLDGYVHVKADTENYRERRKKTLENLARNIASRVKRTRKAVTLEPMNPYERRIIHAALQNDRYVTTYSEGEDPYRRVVVTLKKFI